MTVSMGLESFPVTQVPPYADLAKIFSVQQRLQSLAPLAQAPAIFALRQQLADAVRHKGFVIHAGDCAETFVSPPDYAPKTLKMFQSLHQIFAPKLAGPVVVIGRVAGQYAKPRSALVETIGQRRVPSYHGDIVNGQNVEEREPDPSRMLTAYERSRALIDEMEDLCRQTALKFGHNLFTGHEAYLLPYEEGLARYTDDQQVFGSSGHFLWIGERTRNLDGAHIAFVRSIANPIGIKIGSGISVSDALGLYKMLNPQDQLGRVSFICRFGANHIERVLPGLLKVLKDRPILWVCDPMHGNTEKLDNGIKTRRFDVVKSELQMFFDITKKYGVYPAGMHCEASAYGVTECLDPSCGITMDTMHKNYTTACDPRLNERQVCALAQVCMDNLSR